MLNKLKQYGYSRNAASGVGKKVGGDIYIHKSYISSIMDPASFEVYKSALPSGYLYNVIKLSSKDSKVTFVEAPDFNEANEPQCTGHIVVQIKDGVPVCGARKVNKSIYHAKWLFVKSDYDGFSVTEAMERNLEWKKCIGVDPAISRRIGNADFWDKWLSDNALAGRNPPD